MSSHLCQNQNRKGGPATALTGSIAAGVARISPSAARKLWEAANPGQKVPFDVVRGRFQDMAHILARTDGGKDIAENLKPQEHGEHMAEHMSNGDFARWASRAKDAARSGAEEMGEAIRDGARDSADAASEAVTEVLENPGEAVRDAATAAVEAGESGEIPPP
jgi:hypothetical protein